MKMKLLGVGLVVSLALLGVMDEPALSTAHHPVPSAIRCVDWFHSSLKEGGPAMSVSVDEVGDRQIPRLAATRGPRLSTIHWC